MTLSEEIWIPISNNLPHPLPSRSVSMPSIAEEDSVSPSLNSSDFSDTEDQTSNSGDSNSGDSSSSDSSSSDSSNSDSSNNAASDTTMDNQPKSSETVTSRSSEIAPRTGRVESMETKLPKHVAKETHPKHTEAKHHKLKPHDHGNTRENRHRALEKDAAAIKRQRHKNAVDTKKRHDEKEVDELRDLQIQKAQRDLKLAVRPSSLRSPILPQTSNIGARRRSLPSHPVHSSPRHHQRTYVSKSPVSPRHDIDHGPRFERELDHKAAAYHHAMAQVSRQHAEALRAEQNAGHMRALAVREQAVAAEMQKRAYLSEYQRSLAAHNATHRRPTFMAAMSPSYTRAIEARRRAIRQSKIRTSNERQRESQIRQRESLLRQREIGASRESQELLHMQAVHQSHHRSPEETQHMRHNAQQQTQNEQRQHEQQEKELARQQKQINALSTKKHQVQEDTPQKQIANLRSQIDVLQRTQTHIQHSSNKPVNKLNGRKASRSI
jgi:hypothetical protein